MEMVEVFAQTAARAPTTTQLFNIIKYFALSSLHTNAHWCASVCVGVCVCMCVCVHVLVCFSPLSADFYFMNFNAQRI